MLCYLPWDVKVVVNDINGNLTNLYMVIRDSPSDFINVPYSEVAFQMFTEERLQNVEILNQDFRKVFKNYNAEYIYGTYGELLKGDTNLTSYLYNGKYGVMTDENGLYYMRHRYYNTDIRRFVNQDIVKGNLGNSQSLNRYSYVQGNPLTYTDPFGLSPEKDGGSIGMNIVHGLLDALGCVPGGVGIVANFANAALYAVVDHDYGMAALSLVAGVTLGASKIVSMGGKLAGHAKSIETIGRLVSNTASFAICAEQTVSSSAAMWNKYHEKGAKLSGETALEILGIGLNVAGMAASGKGIVESGNRLGKMVKEGGTTNKMSKGISESGSKSGSGSKFQEVFDLADNYTLSDDTFDNHILDRHGPNSTYGNKSHFNADFDIRNSIDSTLTGDNFIVGPNTAGREGYIFEQTFSNPIGTNSKGKPLYTLKVVIDEAGNVITAFPKK